MPCLHNEAHLRRIRKGNRGAHGAANDEALHGRTDIDVLKSAGEQVEAALALVKLAIRDVDDAA
jgi:hypothetical protein